MNTSDIENPNLGFENPGSGEHSENISLFGKKSSKKVQKFFPSFLADFGLFSLLPKKRRNRPKNFFSDVDFFG